MNAGSRANAQARTFWLGLVVAVITLLASAQSWACSPAEIQRMHRSGISDARIRQLCLPTLMRSEDSRVTARAVLSTNLCRTQQRVCALNQRGSPGQTCWCNSASGPQRGELIAP